MLTPGDGLSTFHSNRMHWKFQSHNCIKQNHKNYVIRVQNGGELTKVHSFKVAL